jgi:hypothetical protein
LEWFAENLGWVLRLLAAGCAGMVVECEWSYRASGGCCCLLLLMINWSYSRAVQLLSFVIVLWAGHGFGVACMLLYVWGYAQLEVLSLLQLHANLLSFSAGPVGRTCICSCIQLRVPVLICACACACVRACVRVCGVATIGTCALQGLVQCKACAGVLSQWRVVSAAWQQACQQPCAMWPLLTSNVGCSNHPGCRMLCLSGQPSPLVC